MEDRPKSDTSTATRMILWLSFLFGIVAYGVVGYLVFRPGVGGTLLPVWLFPLLGVLVAVAAFLLPSRLPDPASGSAVRPREIVGWALAESVAILGLVSVALGGPRGPLAAYLAVSVVILIVLRPSD